MAEGMQHASAPEGQPMDCSPLALLPLDLLALVFEHLPPETVVLDCSRVSRHWYQATKACTFSAAIHRGDWLLWRSAFWASSNADDLQRDVDVVRCGLYLLRVSVRGWGCFLRRHFLNCPARTACKQPYKT